MAMTDRQFKGFVSFVVDALRDVQSEKEPIKQQKKLERIINNLSKTIKD